MPSSLLLTEHIVYFARSIRRGKKGRRQPSWGLLKLKAHEYGLVSGVFSMPVWVKGRDERSLIGLQLNHQVTHLKKKKRKA